MIADRPQHLCKMCGKCCRVTTTDKSYQELLELVKQGDEGASEFLRVFEPYANIEEARKVGADTVDNIVNNLKAFGKYEEGKVDFYKCRYIQDDNRCGDYENRPFLCKFAPASPWTVFPPDCGFNGWLFKKREEKKEMVRKMKENIIDFEAMLPNINTPEQLEKLLHAIETSKKTIALFDKFGAKDW